MVAILVLITNAVMVAIIISIMLVLFHRRHGMNMSCGHDQHESSRQYIPLYTVTLLLHCYTGATTSVLFVIIRLNYCYCITIRVI